MFDHVTIRASDREASERFYTTVLDAIGKPKAHSDAGGAEWDDDFGLIDDDLPATRGLHIAFFVPDTDLVHAFHTAGIQAGYRDDGAPGPRPQYSPTYYGGFLLDPDGNSVEAVVNDRPGLAQGQIDHLWLRGADLRATKVFYEAIGPFAGVRLAEETPDRVTFHTDAQSFSYVTPGAPTQHVHLAFGASTNEQVDAFHAAALATGQTDNGAPGERAVYHPGYYGAFVLDPDGHNVEAVNHNR